MIVGVCTLELFIGSSQSLKEKRFVTKSIKDRVRNKFNVSISETDHLDKWQLAQLAIAMVSNDRKIIESAFDEIVRFIESRGDAEIARKIVNYL